jgi:hypothetical protein
MNQSVSLQIPNNGHHGQFTNKELFLPLGPLHRHLLVAGSRNPDNEDKWVRPSEQAMGASCFSMSFFLRGRRPTAVFRAHISR